MPNTPLHTPRRTAAGQPDRAWRLAPMLCALGLCLATTGTPAALPEPALQEAIREFNKALSGKPQAIEASLKQFEALLQQEPTHPLALAYAGAATSLKARDAWMPWKKMSHAEDGLALIDKALSLLGSEHDEALHLGTPLALQTRFVAATTFLSLPDLFKRGPRGQQLLQDVMAAPAFGRSPAGFQGAVLMWAARHAIKKQETERARALLGEVQRRQLPQQAEAAATLKGL
jgi:hypothetical protein